MDSVELMHAFSWICPNCGRRNFERAIELDKSESDPDEIRKALGLEAWEDVSGIKGQFTLAPENVTCEKCKTQYETIDPSERFDEEDAPT